VGALGFWVATGADRGWTKTSEPVTFVDEVTGLEGIVYEKGFRPGLDFLAAAALGAGLLFGLSFVFRKSNPTSKPI